MNFFDAQDKARSATRWLVLVYLAATVLIVAGVTAVVGFALGAFAPDGQMAAAPILGAAAIGATLLILGSTVFRTAQLASGGGRVAQELGGTLVATDTTDPLRQRLRNVVEEMAIASGVPVPEIYVLEQEAGINAFAAGFSPSDAAVAVTRGTLELLNREELQGVIAHEFSHVLNGDMRLNIRMMGVLFGIMVISLVGRMILRGSHGAVSFGRRGRNAGGILALGAGLAVLGWVGVFFARLIKAAVSRQREYLADASAVQFTRQTNGIANALKKIGGYQARSYIEAADAEQVSHMLFAVGARFSAMFATHPPLGDRIRALEPSFDESQYPKIRLTDQGLSQGDDAQVTAGFAGSDGSVEIAAEKLIESVGQPNAAHIGLAGEIRRSLPDTLLEAAHSTSRAWLLALALIMEPARNMVRPIELLRQQIGDERAELVSRYFEQIADASPAHRLPLLEVAFPALKQNPAQQLDFLLDLARRLIELDGEVSFYEFSVFRVMSRNLALARDPSSHTRRASKHEVREAAIMLLRLVADRGHSSDIDRQEAFAAGASHFGRWAVDAAFEPVRLDAVQHFDVALDVLNRTNGAAKQTLLNAVVATVEQDGRITLAEGEMIRTICASLDCPIPPMLGEVRESR